MSPDKPTSCFTENIKEMNCKPFHFATKFGKLPIAYGTGGLAHFPVGLPAASGIWMAYLPHSSGGRALYTGFQVKGTQTKTTPVLSSSSCPWARVPSPSQGCFCRPIPGSFSGPPLHWLPSLIAASYLCLCILLYFINLYPHFTSYFLHICLIFLFSHLKCFHLSLLFSFKEEIKFFYPIFET